MLDLCQSQLWRKFKVGTARADASHASSKAFGESFKAVHGMLFSPVAYVVIDGMILKHQWIGRFSCQQRCISCGESFDFWRKSLKRTHDLFVGNEELKRVEARPVQLFLRKTAVLIC